MARAMASRSGAVIRADATGGVRCTGGLPAGRGANP
jgi:hypothetical protein